MGLFRKIPERERWKGGVGESALGGASSRLQRETAVRASATLSRELKLTLSLYLTEQEILTAVRHFEAYCSVFLIPIRNCADSDIPIVDVDQLAAALGEKGIVGKIREVIQKVESSRSRRNRSRQYETSTLLENQLHDAGLLDKADRLKIETYERLILEKHAELETILRHIQDIVLNADPFRHVRTWSEKVLVQKGNAGKKVAKPRRGEDPTYFSTLVTDCLVIVDTFSKEEGVLGLVQKAAQIEKDINTNVRELLVIYRKFEHHLPEHKVWFKFFPRREVKDVRG
ncbi:hypothetical protein HYV86_04900 [Candidatus Woesearchaeota archaeon]|nr:hypothetical protein [Candidatus Woesearchaeota archaeon]